MMNTDTMGRTVSVVGLFDTSNEAQNAIQELVNSGVPREQISLVSSHASGSNANADVRESNISTATREDNGTVDGTSVGENVAAGTLFGGLGGLLIGLGALAIPGIGPVVAAGPIAAALAGAGFGALGGGVIGGLKQAGVPEHEADVYAEAVRRGGTIVTVHSGENQSDRVSDILNRNGAVDVDERGTQYRQSGWSGFDQNAGPYRTDDVEATRRTMPGTTLRDPLVDDRAYQRSDVSTDYDNYFRSDYENRYAATGASYDQYRPAYEYGYRMSQDERYRSRQFEDVEPELRRDYESQYPHQPWESFKAAVRHGWQKMTGQR